MSDTVISVENLSKSYSVGHRAAGQGSYSTLREAVTREARTYARNALKMFHGQQIIEGDEFEEFWALKDVSFDVKQGRGHRHHRPQRGRQEHLAENTQPYHRAHAGPGHPERTRGESARSGHRISCRADRP